jgi:hypothetical protein
MLMLNKRTLEGHHAVKTWYYIIVWREKHEFLQTVNEENKESLIWFMLIMVHEWNWNSIFLFLRKKKCETWFLSVYDEITYHDSK